MQKDSLESIRGCGAKTKKKLNDMNIFTCQDLVQYNGPFNGVPITQLQKHAQKIMKNQNDFEIYKITNHTWKGIFAHIIEKSNIVKRVQIGDILIKPFSIKLQVFWKENKILHERHICPISILHVHCLWMYNDIISENSDDDSYETVSKKLPKFLIHEENNNLFQLQKIQLFELHNLAKEVNQLCDCVC